MDKNTLVCRICKFTTPKWINKDGKAKNGFKTLSNHYASDHPSEYGKILDYIDSTTRRADAEEERHRKYDRGRSDFEDRAEDY